MTRPLPEIVAQCVADLPGLRLLVLHGSRARGQAHAGSDWDFAYLADPGLDADTLLMRLVEGVGADRVDLADLNRAGALLRQQVASDGVLLYEHVHGDFRRFQIEAARVWCDFAPVLDPVYRTVLEALPR